MSDEKTPTGKRTDVGYKNPPVETRFKEGQKPPPRKRKKEPADLSPRELLWKILREEKRVLVDGTPKWMRVSEIIITNAYSLAASGSPMIGRMMSEFLMEADAHRREEDVMPKVVFAPEEPIGILHITRRIE